MQNNLKVQRFALRPVAAKVWIAMLVALTLFIPAAVAGAQPAIVVTQATRLFTASSGGWGGGAAPVSGSFAVDVNGNVLWGNTWGGSVFLIDPKTPSATPTQLVSGYNNVAPLTLDSNNNLYIGDTYSSQIIKLPYSATTGYAAWPAGGASAVTTTCTGATSDTAPCNFALNVQDKTGYYGVSSMAFDPSGNFWVAINQWPGAAANGVAGVNNTIFECNSTCQYGKQYDDPPTAIYTDPVDTDAIGAIAFDPWGDLFFSDDAVNETGPGNGGTTTTSGLYELALSNGSYASTPTQLESFTNTQGYSDGIFGVAVDGNGTIYYCTPGEGIFAIPNTQGGGPNTAKAYAISPIGGKGIALNRRGDIFQVAYSGGDGITKVTYGNLSLGASPVGTAVSTASNISVTVSNTATTETVSSVTVADNAGSCSTNPVLAIAGAQATDFTAAATAIVPPATVAATCSTALTGGSFLPVTVTFTPTTPGERSALLTVTDTVNSAAGTATAAGAGQGALVTLDPGVWTSYSTGFTSPESISVDAAGNLAIADSTANKVFLIASGSSTPVSIGTGFSNPDATAFDAHGDLFIADAGNNQIVEIPNVSGSLSAPGQTVAVASTVLFGGTALNGPSGLAFGPEGVLFISDLQNGRVVAWNPINGLTYVRATGLSFPWGLAVDAAGNLFVAETGGGDVKVYQSGGVVTTLTPAGITEPWAVAVDASGSVLISDKASGKIVRVPNEAGALNGSDAIVVETNPMSAYGLALDSAGNLYTTDSAGAAAYAVQRTAASLNLGSVDDDSTGEETLYVESAGNTALTLGSPIFTAPSNAMFSLAAGAPVGCSSSFKGKEGTVCELTATFAPPNDVVAAAQTGTSTLSSNALNAASATISLSGTNVFEDLLAQAITFTPPTSPVAFGVKPISLVATGGASGNPVVFSVLSGPATVSGSTLTITGVGTVVVAANQAGNSTYSSAPQVTVTIVVNKAAQTIHFPAPVTGPVTFDKVKTVTLHATATSGLKVKFSVASGPGTILGDTLTITGAGTITVTAKQAGNADYLAAVPVNQKVVVNKASQKITFAALPSTVAYGIKPITLKATSTSKLLVKFSVLSGPATVKGDLLSIDGAGIVVVAAEQLGNVDFDAAPQVKQTIKVDKAQLIVAASDLTMKQGAAVPTLTYAITGFVNKDTQKTSTTGKPALSTTATSSSPAGTYPIDITVGTLKSTKYSFKFADGKLKVQ